MNFWPEEWRKSNNNNNKKAQNRLPSDINCPRWELLCLRWSPVKMEFLRVTNTWSDPKHKIKWNSNIVGTVYPWVIEGQLRKWRMKNRVVCHFSHNLKVCSRISSSFLLKNHATNHSKKVFVAERWKDKINLYADYFSKGWIKTKCTIFQWGNFFNFFNSQLWKPKHQFWPEII